MGAVSESHERAAEWLAVNLTVCHLAEWTPPVPIPT
jgi:hypothetical protein